MKQLFIAEKPSVAQEFARVLGVNGRRQNGYLESGDTIVTWCVGHLVTMSYPEKYDQKYKRWDMETLPFLPDHFLYEVIEDVKPQFEIVKKLLNREDVGTIYICTDSGREGEYIYRLVDQMAGVRGKERKRVWIDSQTEEEILRGVREAKDWSAYDNLSAAAYLRAQEDYLMGINFSRALTLKYGSTLSAFLKNDRKTVVSVGRVMTCVLGMVVRREREIRDFVKTPFYRVIGTFSKDGLSFSGEWRAVEGSRYFESPKLYKENGFRKRDDAEELIRSLSGISEAKVLKAEKKKEIKNAPLLYNLAELQNDCSRRFKISPDETLKIVQELYEKKLVTYPRTDARVLSTAVAKEIGKNLSGLRSVPEIGVFAEEVLAGDVWKRIGKTRYTNDAQITDHYAIIPTGQGLGALRSLKPLAADVYDMICRRFLSIFYPPAVFERKSIELLVGMEHFFSTIRFQVEEGWMKVAGVKNRGPVGSSESGNSGAEKAGAGKSDDGKSDEEDMSGGHAGDPRFRAMIDGLKKGSVVTPEKYEVKEGETSPPKRYTSGSMILAMENAGQLIEDEELRSQIKGSGIGTSATRAEILKKLFNIRYLALNAKTQVITPTLLGEMIYEAVEVSMKQLLNPELTASWEKGLTMVSNGTISPDEYMDKLKGFVGRRTGQVKSGNAGYLLRDAFLKTEGYYRGEKRSGAGGRKTAGSRKNSRTAEINRT
ncbi:MAG: type IA DNA topoisomerase [Stomatobaculum sp.]|nr:type IA DNA topoisomerase [Stomatobaculum sp.]